MKKETSSGLLVVTLLLLSHLICAQVTITFPNDRAVFQRNNDNEALVYVGGYVTETFSSIEARFVPLVSGEGEPAPSNGQWSVIQSSLAGPNFYGSMTVKGGWYKLEVRGVKDGSTPKVATLAHVGVGEVFVIAGQSNATGGDSNPNGPGAAHDQVNSVNYQNYNPGTGEIAPYSNIKLPCPEFVHLDASVKTAPFGNYAWCWGSFGDKIYEKLRVPVMIFNAGWSSSDIDNWKSSINPTKTPLSAFGYQFPAGLPFGHLRVALNNYAAQLGVRAVLWHQGETDNYLEKDGDETDKNYLASITKVIEATRNQSEKSNLAWVVARASRFTVNGASRTSAKVIKAQNDIINNDAHVFPGPETDPYYDINYRGDEVHFRGDGVTPSPDGHVYSGLIYLAGFWADKIDNTFLTQSVPYAAIAPPKVTSEMLPTSTNTTLNGPASVPNAEYNWLIPNDCNSAIATTQNYSVGVGTYQLKIIMGNDSNTVLSPKLYVSGMTTLPVTWKYVNAQTSESNRAVVLWGTTSEKNASHFDVERSTDARSFSRVTSIKAAANSQDIREYSFTDEFLPAGDYYYRLKQVDLDEKSEYSRILHVRIAGKTLVRIFPNPVSEKLNIESEIALNLVEIISINGVKFHSGMYQSKAVQLDVKNLPAGLYTVTINGVAYKVMR